MLPDLSVLWVVFFILVLTLVVDRLLLRPVLGVIRKREEAIESARELAHRSATEAQAAAAEFDRETAAARAEMYREMDEMRRGALNPRAEMRGRPARGSGGAGRRRLARSRRKRRGEEAAGSRSAGARRRRRGENPRASRVVATRCTGRVSTGHTDYTDQISHS